MSGTPDWDGLGKAIDGEVVRPGSAGYETARKPPLARWRGSRPQAVVSATTAADVAEIIGFGRRSGLRTTPRAGGHCFAGRSSAGEIVLDVSPMRSVSVSDGVATVGAGTRLGALDEALAAHGRALPAGCGRTVGIAGLALGGGLGLLGRKHGLTSDQLLGARVVLADGRVLDCDDEHDGDLFWALRGAGGGNFGVVTSLVFRTVAAPRSTCIRLEWPPAHAAAVVEAWQDWAPAAPDELDAELRLAVGDDRDRVPTVTLVGAMIGTETDAEPLLRELAARAGADPTARSVRSMPYVEVKRQLSGPDAAGPDELPHRPEFSKSEFFRRRLPRRAITALLDGLLDRRGSGQSRQVNLTPWGGAYNRIPAEATAFAHRDELFMIEHAVSVDPAAPGAEVAGARAWLAASWAAVHPYGSGRVYPNFPDPDLEDWPDAYHAGNYGRLLQVKHAYDPDDWFHFRQSIGSPPTLGPAGPAREERP